MLTLRCGQPHALGSLQGTGPCLSSTHAWVASLLQYLLVFSSPSPLCIISLCLFFFLTKHFIAKKKKNKLSKSSVSHNVFAVEGFEIFQKLPKPDGDMT